MNVVGKFGSLISQGVYSVATPFHPFGGAVDVIVVRQQDGTFRSTPWYVRFGKFQGVLRGAEKGAEKIVRIKVNGVEANFHMYLDNSGEAYFVKEVEDDKGIESNVVVEDSNKTEITREDSGVEIDNKSNNHLSNGHGLDHCISDSRVLQLKDGGDFSVVPQIQRVESDADRIFYEFQDDNSSFEGSVELSEYRSNPYESLDGEKFVDSDDIHPEVVLVSVDGHILTAPISELKQNEENVQLSTPRFHLGPGEETDLCEGNEDFSSRENDWTVDYINQMDASTGDVPPRCCNTNSDDNASRLLRKVCQGEEAHICQAEETVGIKDQEAHTVQTDSEEVAPGIKSKNVFKSCLELQELAQQVGNADLQDVDSSLEAQNLAVESNLVDENQQESIVQSESIDELSLPNGSTSSVGHRSPKSELRLQEAEKNESGQVDTGSGCHSVAIDTEWNYECDGKSVSNDGVDDSQQTPALENVSNRSEVVEPQTAISNNGDPSNSGLSRTRDAKLLLLDLPVEPKDTIPMEQDYALKSRDDNPKSTWSGRKWRLWPIPFRKVKTIKHTSSSLSTEDIFLDSESTLQSPLVEPTPTSSTPASPHKQFVRTNVPTNEQVASLNLKDGQNLVTFSFSTRVLGTQQVDAHIYLWKWNAKIVISDVDGTITKSDVLGQFMPLVGKDWTQSGVASLFSAIKENGYQLLFLSARAIVQAYLTRNFLLNLKQDGKTLPNGPIVISPDGLFPSLFREVIRRAPHEFKIACLEDIKKLFPPDYNPFYAGFGNRDTDELSYRKIGIPKGKIFIINPKGEVAISQRIGKSYTSLHTLVNDMFPPTSLVEQEDFNSWNYWKMPLPDID